MISALPRLLGKASCSSASPLKGSRSTMAALKNTGQSNIWMISFVEFIEEEVRNPLVSALKNMAREGEGLHFIISKAGDLFVPPSSEYIHHQMGHNVGLGPDDIAAASGFIYADGEGVHYVSYGGSDPAVLDWERHLKTAGLIFH
jgi:hypothetical protein